MSPVKDASMVAASPALENNPMCFVLVVHFCEVCQVPNVCLVLPTGETSIDSLRNDFVILPHRLHIRRVP
jgi:hypothetical protein